MKILAVDDDEIILGLLKEVLRAAGYTNVTTCSAPECALEEIKKTNVPFDCFLFDIQMPSMDGIQLTAAVRSLQNYSKTPILMITAMCDRSYVDRAFEVGASDYITKPFEIGEIHMRLRTIDELVTQRKRHDDRNPVSKQENSVTLVTKEDMQKRLMPADINGMIDYLALENYLMQMSRVSLLGIQALGIVVPHMERMFLSSTRYEYESTVADVAEAISDTLRPLNFFISHAGSGEFIIVLRERAGLEIEEFEHELRATLTEMDLHYCDGRPLILRPVVGPARSLQFKSSRGISSTLVKALKDAEELTQQDKRYIAMSRASNS